MVWQSDIKYLQSIQEVSILETSHHFGKPLILVNRMTQVHDHCKRELAFHSALARNEFINKEYLGVHWRLEEAEADLRPC